MFKCTVCNREKRYDKEDLREGDPEFSALYYQRYTAASPAMGVIGMKTVGDEFVCGKCYEEGRYAASKGKQPEGDKSEHPHGDKGGSPA